MDIFPNPFSLVSESSLCGYKVVLPQCNTRKLKGSLFVTSPRGVCGSGPFTRLESNGKEPVAMHHCGAFTASQF